MHNAFLSPFNCLIYRMFYITNKVLADVKNIAIHKNAILKYNLNLIPVLRMLKDIKKLIFKKALRTLNSLNINNTVNLYKHGII